MFKALVAIKRDILREKIAGLISREKEIWSTVQVCDEDCFRKSIKENRPDIVVYDMDEDTFSKECLRELKIGGEIILIAFSGEAAEEYRQAAKDAGADEYACPDSLNKVIRKTIETLCVTQGSAKTASM